MNICLVLLSLALVGREPGVFNVRDFGAKGDGQTVETLAIQKAIDAAAAAGGGKVVFPAGHYISKPILLKSKVTIHLEQGAILQATSNHQDFMERPGDWLKAASGDFVPLISGKDLTDVTLEGEGTIDGNGQHWWGPAEKARQERPGYTLPRPNLIVFTRCKNLRIRGLTIQNSPKFHIVPVDCEDVVIEDVVIKAPSGAANTDGIDPSISRKVRIARCIIDVGDDNIAIKSGKRLPGREYACEQITVVDCQFLHGHGMSIGSETIGGIRNVTVERCSFKGTENGIRIKTARDRGGVVKGLRCTDIKMSDVDRAITITCYYPRIPKDDNQQPVTDLTPSISDIYIKGLKATCPNSAGVIIGLPESPIKDVVLEDVHITARTGLTIRNARSVTCRAVDLVIEKGPPLIIDNAQVDGLGQ